MESVTAADTLQEAILWFADFEHCKQFMMDLRWPDGVVKCPQCGAEKVTWLAKTRKWKCYAKHPRPTFTLKSGTIFEDSPLPLEKWLPAAWLVINCKNGISSYELHRALGVTQKSTWFMLHRVRLAMKSGTFEKLKGTVEVGGKQKLMNNKTRARAIANGRFGAGTVGKAIVMGLLERHGKAHVKVMASRKRRSLAPAVVEHVEAGSTLYTDQLRSYNGLAYQYAHEVIDHTEEYVKGNVHTNGMRHHDGESRRISKLALIKAKALLIRIRLQVIRLHAHVRAFQGAFEQAPEVLQIVGRRLTYAQLTGKIEDQTVTLP